MRFSGNGDWNFGESLVGVPFSSSVLDPQSTTGTLSTYGLSGGVAASLSF